MMILYAIDPRIFFFYFLALACAEGVKVDGEMLQCSRKRLCYCYSSYRALTAVLTAGAIIDPRI